MVRAMLDTVPTPVLDDLRRRHAEPQRFYHDWSHVEALLRHFAATRDRIADPEAVLYAILFHDAVYDPTAKDNERRSAALLNTALAGPDAPLAPASLALAERMILATEGHRLPEPAGLGDDDLAHFLDMDLAILGASEERFDIYEDQIRREYAHVPPDAYRKGRSAVLESFAARPLLYFTDWGRSRFEGPARANVSRSLARLAASE